MARMAGELLYIHGTKQDLTGAPLAKTMAGYLVHMHQATITPVPVVEKDEATIEQGLSAGAMS